MIISLGYESTLFDGISNKTNNVRIKLENITSIMESISYNSISKGFTRNGKSLERAETGKRRKKT